MPKCNICKRDYPSLFVTNTSQLFVEADMNLCNRCRDAIKNAEKLMKYFKYIKDENLRDQYINLFKGLCLTGTDKIKGDECVRMLEAPAGRRRHHSYSGGLLTHIIQMIEIAFIIYGQNTMPFQRVLNKGDIVIGCFIHDLHKAINTFVRDDNNAQCPFRYTYENKYLSADMQSIKILMDAGIKLTEDQLNCLIMAEGGWSDLANKLELSKLAVLIHMADLYSSQILKK